jgi:poly(ADP-ribose) glycohydrolase ARH3
MDLPTKFLGAMIGSGLGDALGELAFRYGDKNRLLARISDSDILTYTDDTAMTLALAESLTAVGDLDEERLGRTFHEYFTREPWRGYGPGPPAIFARVAVTGVSYKEAARALYDGQGSLGNGAAMRITPLALYFFDSAQLYHKAEKSARITHAHPIGIDGAAVQARAIALALAWRSGKALQPGPFVQDLIAFARTTLITAKLEKVLHLIEADVTPAKAVADLGLSVAVHESMPFSLYCFLRYPGRYEDCLLCAILNGGDRDTMGAMAGALSGAYLGTAAIPAAWQSKLENRRRIEALSRRLVELRSKPELKGSQ